MKLVLRKKTGPRLVLKSNPNVWMRNSTPTGHWARLETDRAERFFGAFEPNREEDVNKSATIIKQVEPDWLRAGNWAILSSVEQGQKRAHPHSCQHHSRHIAHFPAKWNDGEPIGHVRVCRHCGKLWPVRKVQKSWVMAIPLKAGQRWITVHPHGEDEPGIPVLIQEHEDGTASVVRGAGGKLNYLRLNKLRSPDEWKQSREENRLKREAALARRQSGMSDEEKAKEAEYKSQVRQSKVLRDTEYVQTVMEAHGVAAEQWKLPERVVAAMPPKSRELAERRHLRRMVKVANQLVDEAREDVLAAGDKVIHETIGDLPGSTILPESTPSGAGKGYVAAVSRKAEENGLTVDAKKRESAEISWNHFLEVSNGNKEEAAKKKACVERMQAALAEIRKPVKNAQKLGLLDVKITPDQPKVEDISKILVAQKQQKELEQRYKKIQQEVAESGVPNAAFVTATDIDEAAAKAMEPMSIKDAKEALADELRQDMMQLAASRLLEATDEETTKAPLREHVGVGHYDAINEAALAATHEPCPIDRIRADILGPAATAQVLAEHWRRQLPKEEFEAVKEGIAAYHTKTQADIANGAVNSYKEACRNMDAVEVPAITDSASLLRAQLANDERAQFLSQGRRVLGVALGKLEGQAALVDAMMQGSPSELKVSLGAISGGDAVARARAMGLERSDYQIDSDGVNKFLTVNRSGIDKLVGDTDPDLADKAREVLAIKNGERDEDGWLPKGIVSRPATTFDDPHERALMLTEPLSLDATMTGDRLRSSLEDYIGARLADGQDPESLRADLLSAEFTSSVPAELLGEGTGPYYQALKDLGFYGFKQVENLTGDDLNDRAERVVAARRKKLGDDANLVALNSQSIPINEGTYEAVHRALAKVPAGVVACLGTSELTPQHKGVLRDYFWQHLTDERPPVASETRAKTKEAAARAQEVVGHQVNIFGETEEVKRGAEVEEKPTEHAWDRYVKAMGGTEQAYQAVRDVIRGELMSEVARALGSITGTEIKTGAKRIANWDRHILGLLSPERQAQLLGDRATEKMRRQAQVASRAGGKFAREEKAGARAERAEALMQAMRQSQMKLFTAGKEPAAERVTLGERAEAQLARVLPILAKNFNPKQPVEIPKSVSMSGKYVRQQRAIKMHEATRRMGLHLGVGSGKSLIALGSFANLESKGKVKRAIFAVPSVVQGQFGGEALRYFEPGKYRWFANPAASPEERRAAYADSSTHLCVVTHQALRDDLSYAVAQDRFGGDESKADEWMKTASEKERKAGVKHACDKLGWKFDMSVVDEGHTLLDRSGKPDSRMAHAIDSLTFNTPYYMSMTGDPIKNDPSEAWSMLHKMDPDRYPDKQAFLTKYGVDTAATRVALQRELAPYSYTGHIKPDVAASRPTKVQKLLPEQESQYAAVLANYQKARQARRKGGVDVAAVEAMAPHMFDGLSAAEREAKAKQLSQSLAITRDAALQRIVQNGHVDRRVTDAPCAKIQELIADIKQRKLPDGSPAPGLVFARSLDSVKRLKRELTKHGIKVGTLTGSHSSADKEKAKLQFQNGDFQVLVLSNAGAVGANLQRAAFCHQFDTPDTAMLHEQRIGRMERLGQKNTSIEAVDFVSDTPYERTARRRLAKKDELREIFTAPTEGIDDTGLAHEIWSARQRKLQKDVIGGGGARISMAMAAEADKG